MKHHRIRLALGGLALTGALVGGGAAVAFAQTSTTPSTESPSTTAPSTTAPSTTAPSDSTTKPDPANCPNMGGSSRSGTGTGASTHARQPSSSNLSA